MKRAISRLEVIPIILLLVLLGTFGAYLAMTRYYGSTCAQSAESNVYLTIANDSSSARIGGVEVTGNVKWLCGSNSPPGYFIASQDIGTLYTPSNGTLLIGNNIGNYTLTLYYSNHSYHVHFSPGADENINVTVSLPSDKMAVIGCVFGSNSICFNETNPNSATLISTTKSASR